MKNISSPLLRLTFLMIAVGLSAAGCAQDYGPPPGDGPPPGPYPNLTQAEEYLQSAIASLHQAPPIFGGHKAEAVKLIESAIIEIKAAKASVP